MPTNKNIFIILVTVQIYWPVGGHAHTHTHTHTHTCSSHMSGNCAATFCLRNQKVKTAAKTCNSGHTSAGKIFTTMGKAMVNPSLDYLQYSTGGANDRWPRNGLHHGDLARPNSYQYLGVDR
ncbi:hypothetical protein, unlikely [Trypanosoma brucei gambiense DAL972]|uniref:Secreted protein n=1 Tax=Trypanosoma brucei gambiense (strain MHOM/CI/86/DAL972) TaxID=679716 RepID=C9ZIQ2_TRYB9|nr:hypothetical protein, unlikely [Trypanosoma brucei gambiense DAL972]CBH09044.1 hypothetical protein, unlikely [Trypanosoma brucei gambiense DAL972]|eukprot:XP_011771485.1 hypothetical protein, unlikely [Trypanosoma brucei gambiense DAL972]